MPYEVLIVEDDDAIRALLTVVLRRDGFLAESVTNGQVAVDRLAEHRYDVILLDLMLPVMNGLEVIAHIERADLMGCVIVLTAAAEPEVRKIDGKPVFAILRKPFDLAHLLSTVQECILANSKKEPTM
jgi:two-component system response regulator AtoC